MKRNKLVVLKIFEFREFDRELANRNIFVVIHLGAEHLNYDFHNKIIRPRVTRGRVRREIILYNEIGNAIEAVGHAI